MTTAAENAGSPAGVSAVPAKASDPAISHRDSPIAAVNAREWPRTDLRSTGWSMPKPGSNVSHCIPKSSVAGPNNGTYPHSPPPPRGRAELEQGATDRLWQIFHCSRPRVWLSCLNVGIPADGPQRRSAIQPPIEGTKLADKSRHLLPERLSSIEGRGRRGDRRARKAVEGAFYGSGS